MNIKLVAEEAARILFENPHLKYYEAINEAKKILKEKESIAGKQNRFLQK